MQLLADENIQQPTVRFFRERGWDVLWAAEEGLSGAPDERIFEYAQRRRRILLTYNAHFADIRELSAHGHHGVIRLRYGNQRADFVHARLLAALDRLKGQDLRDTLVTLTDDRVPPPEDASLSAAFRVVSGHRGHRAAMGFYLTESEAETTTERSRVHAPRPTRVRPQNRIGAPKRNRILSTKYADDETGLLYYGLVYWPIGME